jgi:hypothetical protein
MTLSVLGTSATIRPIVQALDYYYYYYYECGAVCGMTESENLSIRRKPASVPLSPPQIPYYMTCARTWAAAVISMRLTA